jgi:RND family efflux transporter MFP subunit
VNLYPRVNAFVDKVLVDRGSKVKSGELLARLSAPELAAQRTEAESKLRASESTTKRLQAAAATEGAVARHDIELADAQLKADRSRVSSLRSLESYLVVRAPFDGMVTERNVHPGALVGPPTGPSMPPMLRVEQLARLRLVVAVPESEAAAIAEGATAEFAVRAWPDRRFSGVIRRLSHSLDARTRTMPVELDVENTDGKLAPGMYVDVYWPVRRSTASLFVPPSAVAQTTERTYVLRVKDGRLEQVVVTRGVATSGRLEVFGELAAGETVVRRPSEELRPGAAVRVAAPRTAPKPASPE